jgi:hypothetical protein
MWSIAEQHQFRVNAIWPLAQLPGAPTIGTAIVSNGQAVISFTPPTVGYPASFVYTATSSPGGFTGRSGSKADVVNYYIYDQNILATTNSSAPIKVDGLVSGTIYTFTVTATNPTGTGPASDISNSITFYGVPGVPTIGTATATGSTTATVSFTAPGSNGGSVITSYTATAYLYPSGTATGITGTLSQAGSGTVTVTGLNSGTGYTFTVYATNFVGNSSSSAASNSITTTAVVPSSVEYVIVAGGGGGGYSRGGNHVGGGGGAGGMLTSASLSVSSSLAYSITVGAGGPVHTNGNSSAFASTSTIGGGYGSGGTLYPDGGSTGGSGGGGSGGAGSAGTAGQGNAGSSSGGGGGAGSAGTINGGIGLQSSITGVSTYYAGGGAGYGGLGGLGGGGNSSSVFPTPGGAGTPNTGGGGGSASLNGAYNGQLAAGGEGGSGIVVIAYQTTYLAPTYIDPGLTYTVDNVTRSGYRVYKFTGGTGSIAWATGNTVPGAPTNISAGAASSRTALVQFTAPNYTGGSAIISYTATSSPGNITGTASASPVTVSGLTDGTAYTFTVKATNAIGTGPVSDIPSNSITIGDVYYPYVGALIKTSSTNGRTNSSFIDSSGNGLTVTRVGTPSGTYFNPYGLSIGSAGGSAYFNGSTDYLSIATSTAFGLSTSNFTIECWAYPTANPANGPGTLYDLRTAATASATVARINSALRLLIYNGPSNIETTLTGTTVTLNAWNHIAVVRDSGTVTGYINGVSAGSATIAGNLGTNQPCIIGTNRTAGYSWNGYITDFRVVNGSAVVPTGSGPTAPLTAVANTSLLLNFNGQNNIGIYDAAYDSITTGPAVITAGSAQASSNTYQWSPTSVLLNGTTDYLRLPYNSRFQPTSQDFTVELWIYFNSVVINQRIAGQDNNSSTLCWAIYTTAAGTLNYYLSSTGNTWNIASGIKIGNIATGQWYHVALVRSGSTFTPYLNGSSSGGVITTNSNALFASTSPLTIGASGVGGNFANAYVQDFRLTVGVARYSGTPFTTPKSSFIATSAPTGAPRTPIIGTATAATPTSAVVSFTQPDSDGGSTITGYTAVSSPGGLTGTVAQSGSGSVTVTGLTQNTAYTFKVYATNAYGNSLSSSSSNSITTQTAATPFFSYLVVAGGGGGGGGNGGGGGGGAGGLLTGNVTYTAGVKYTVSVGPGGSGHVYSPRVAATSGTNSSISGTGLTTITAIGGGRGGALNGTIAPETGGSGGGGGVSTTTTVPTAYSLGAAGTSGQGNSGGNGTASSGNPNIGPGGGGGAGAPGSSNTTPHRGGEPGGIGAVSYLVPAEIASSRAVGQISNGFVYFAGGGGGGGYCGSTINPIYGGTGGGGNGGEGIAGTAGTANTGGGGGAGADACGSVGKDGAAGGSGVVVISSPYTATATTGSVYVDTVGNLKIYTFIDSGTITF